MYRIGEKEIDAVARVIRSGQLFRYGASHETADFEKELTAKTGTEFAVAVTSGTAALICGLAGMGIGPGDEVIVPGYTFIASALAVLAVGAIPIIAEVDESLTLDPEDAEKKISPHTRAIMPVHMMGLPCDMDRIMAVAGKHNLLVMEDCCQADGGSYKGRRLGSFGNAGAFSYNFFKIITCGEGGAVVTSDPAIYQRAINQHDGGTIYWPEAQKMEVGFFAGWNFRMNEIMAAILREQLKRLDPILTALRKRKQLFVESFADHPRLRMIRYNDLAGDCGVTVGFYFDTAEEAIAFAQKTGGGRPYDTGRHVYCNWEPVMEKKGAHHPARDPFYLRENRECRTDYSKDMCPKTLDILSRTVFIGMNPDMPIPEVRKIIQQISEVGWQL